MNNQTVRPPGWHDCEFSLKEISQLCDITFSTLNNWLLIGRAAGIQFGEKPKGRRFFCAHDMYVAFLLTKLARSAIPVNAKAITAAVDFAKVLPSYGEEWNFTPSEGGASVVVDAWLCFVAARAAFERLRNV